MSKLGWSDEEDTESYRLDGEHIEAVTSDALRLRR
jgi:hypothetical protein